MRHQNFTRSQAVPAQIRERPVLHAPGRATLPEFARKPRGWVFRPNPSISFRPLNFHVADRVARQEKRIAEDVA
jgi:hypothetical protein